MTMRMIIVGNSGSGKTWLASKLAQLHGFPVIHLDNIFWEPGGFDKKRSPATMDAMIDALKQDESWIVEGVFGDLAAKFIKSAQYFVWLDIDWSLCRERLIKRSLASKQHMGRQETAQNTQELLEWASQYYQRNNWQSYQSHKKMLEGFHGKKIHLNSEADIDTLIEETGRKFLRR